MFYSTALLATSALVALVSAQNTSYPIGGPYTIDPNTIPIANRTSWCNAEQGNCPLVCGGRSNLGNNTCDATTLVYSCTCADGNTPNITSFANMIPAYECIQWVNGCVAAAGNDLNKLTNCRSVVCGNRDPGKVPQTGSSGGGSASSSAAPSGSATASSTRGSGGSTASSSAAAQTSTGAAVALNAVSEYGTPILAAGMLGLFGLAL